MAFKAYALLAEGNGPLLYAFIPSQLSPGSEARESGRSFPIFWENDIGEMAKKPVVAWNREAAAP